MHIGIAIDIAAPPDAVWAVMSDVERWHEWTASITSVERLDGGPLAVGSTALVKQPRLLPARFTVTHMDGRSFTWTTRSAGVTATARHAVEATEHGSRATLSVEFAGILGGIVGRLTGGLTRRYLRMEAEGLKRRSEARHESAG